MRSTMVLSPMRGHWRATRPSRVLSCLKLDPYSMWHPELMKRDEGRRREVGGEEGEGRGREGERGGGGERISYGIVVVGE